MPRPQIAGVPVRSWDLGTPLVRLSPADAWTIGDACEGTQIFGATGAGKTSGSGQAIALAMLREGFGGLVLTAKPDERRLWQTYAALTGRTDDLVIFGGGSPHRFNFLDVERTRGGGAGLTENLVALFATVLEAMDGDGAAASRDPFWGKALRQLLRNTVDLLILAGEELSVTAMSRLVGSAPTSPMHLRDEHWKAGSYCWRCLDAADRGVVDPFLRQDLGITSHYWCQEFPGLAEQTRSSIVITFTAQVDGFIRGELRKLFCTTTTITPEATQHGRIIVIDLPIKTYYDLGRFAQILWKSCWQRATEARMVDAATRPVFLWADESQLFLTKADQEFQSTARSAKAATVYLTQNLPSYYNAIGGGNRDAVNSFLGVLQTKVFHANGDPETNEWAERMIGREEKTRFSMTTQQGGNGSPSQGTSINRQVEPSLMARAFTLLKKGGPANGMLVDAIVFQGGRVWKAGGRTYLNATFPQVHAPPTRSHR